MREPTREEMVEGVKLAVADQLILMNYGPFEDRPPSLLGAALRAAAKEVIADWLRQNEDKLISAIASAAAEKRGD